MTRLVSLLNLLAIILWMVDAVIILGHRRRVAKAEYFLLWATLMLNLWVNVIIYW